MKEKNQNNLSRQLVKLTRHTGQSRGLSVGSDGFIPLTEIMDLLQIQQQEIEKCVEKDEKNRLFMMQIDGKWFIRANQGHSMPVQVEMKTLLNPLELENLIHATFIEKIPLILAQGLSRMRRQHIHFTLLNPFSLDSSSFNPFSLDSSSLDSHSPTFNACHSNNSSIDSLNTNSLEKDPNSLQSKVIPGIRKHANALIFINAALALSDGIVFYKSHNQVILSPGDSNGFLLPKYFLKIQTVEGREIPIENKSNF